MTTDHHATPDQPVHRRRAMDGAPRPDAAASMTLLTEVMTRPLDPGYAMAARRRAADRASAPGERPATRALATRTLATRALSAVLAAVCGLATTWAVVQLRRPAPDAVAARRALEGQIQHRLDHADAAQRPVAELAAAIDGARADLLAGSDAAGLTDQAGALGRSAGLLAVTGPGIEVALDDPPAANAGAGRRVHVLDRDLQIVVNGLWAAGAEAVAVNGNRLTTMSAIRTAGEAVLVDLQPLLPPYRVSAIGNPSALEVALASGMVGPYLDVLRGDGIVVKVDARPSLVLAGAPGTVGVSHASTVPSRTPGTSPSPARPEPEVSR